MAEMTFKKCEGKTTVLGKEVSCPFQAIPNEDYCPFCKFEQRFRLQKGIEQDIGRFRGRLKQLFTKKRSSAV